MGMHRTKVNMSYRLVYWHSHGKRDAKQLQAREVQRNLATCNETYVSSKSPETMSIPVGTSCLNSSRIKYPRNSERGGYNSSAENKSQKSNFFAIHFHVLKVRSDSRPCILPLETALDCLNCE